MMMYMKNIDLTPLKNESPGGASKPARGGNARRRNPSLLAAGIACLLWAWLFSPVSAQTPVTYQEVLTWALTNHPVATTAAAVEQRGRAERLRARAALDPKLGIDYDRKDFKGTEYFDYGTAELSWQSPYALKIAGGYQRAEGAFLSAERTVPERGQAYLALKLPLLRGLMTDATRIGLKRGELAIDRQRAVADVLRNDLRYDLTLRYLEWTFTARAVDLNRLIEGFLEQRLVDYRSLVRQGDKPAVDTLEATVYLGQQRQILNQAVIDEDLARAALAELYWPLEAEDRPVAISIVELTAGLAPDATPEGHPELRQLQLQLRDASLARDLKREELKPELNLSYYLLGDGFALPETNGAGPFTEAYKLGVTASYPLLNRKARAGVQLGELKVIESEAKLNGKTQALQVKVAAYRVAIDAYAVQLAAAETLAEQAGRLLEAERELYRLGESTQFLINAREQAFLKARLGVVKLSFGRGKMVAGWRYLLGR